MLTIYYGKSCSSNRHAKKWLLNEGIPFREKDFRFNPMTEQDILFLLKLSYNGVEDIISTRSTLYKENIDLLNSLKLSELVRFITLHPALLRSPILFDHKQFITGFNEERARCFIPRHRRKVGMNDFLFTLESDYLTKQANKQTNK